MEQSLTIASINVLWTIAAILYVGHVWMWGRNHAHLVKSSVAKKMFISGTQGVALALTLRMCIYLLFLLTEFYYVLTLMFLVEICLCANPRWLKKYLQSIIDGEGDGKEFKDIKKNTNTNIVKFQNREAHNVPFQQYKQH